jgi:hypothetical protein
MATSSTEQRGQELHLAVARFPAARWRRRIAAGSCRTSATGYTSGALATTRAGVEIVPGSRSGSDSATISRVRYQRRLPCHALTQPDVKL